MLVSGSAEGGEPFAGVLCQNDSGKEPQSKLFTEKPQSTTLLLAAKICDGYGFCQSTTIL
jgi:hypothetical protein